MDLEKVDGSLEKAEVPTYACFICQDITIHL